MTTPLRADVTPAGDELYPEHEKGELSLAGIIEGHVGSGNVQPLNKKAAFVWALFRSKLEKQGIDGDKIKLNAAQFDEIARCINAGRDAASYEDKAAHADTAVAKVFAWYPVFKEPDTLAVDDRAATNARIRHAMRTDTHHFGEGDDAEEVTDDMIIESRGIDEPEEVADEDIEIIEMRLNDYFDRLGVPWVSVDSAGEKTMEALAYKMLDAELDSDEKSAIIPVTNLRRIKEKMDLAIEFARTQGSVDPAKIVNVAEYIHGIVHGEDRTDEAVEE